jgi:hypothetical protein
MTASRSALAALAAAALLSSCGGSRSPNEPAVPSPNGDMTVTQSGPATVGAGGMVTFNAVVLNAGRTEVGGITVTQTLSANYTAIVGCTPSTGAECPSQLGPVVTVPSLPAGRWVTLSYQVQVPAANRGAIVNQVQVSSAGDPDGSNNLSSFTTTAINASNGAYVAYAADGRQYDFTVDFDALQYTMAGNGQSVQKSFTASGAEYIVAGNSRLRIAPDLVVGSHDFGSGSVPYVAARSFLTTLADSAYNLATVNVATGAAATTHPGSARISGNSLLVCQTDADVYASQNCPVVLTSYQLVLNGNVFGGVDATGQPFAFRLARSGGSVILLSAQTAPDGSQQLRIGLQESAGLTWGTLFGPTGTGDWITMVLDPVNISYAVLGTTTNDQAGLQKISNSGPFAMMFGQRVTDSADIYVMQNSPLAIAIGAFDGTANGMFQVAVP